MTLPSLCFRHHSFQYRMHETLNILILKRRYRPGKFEVQKSERLSFRPNFEILPHQTLYIKLASLLGEDHADAVFNNIRNKVCESDAPVLEVRADLGILSKKLLAAGVKNLHIFEKRNSRRPQLLELISQYKDQAFYHQRTFNELFLEASNAPLYSSPYLKESLPFKLDKAWNDSPSMTVIVTHTSVKVLIVALLHLSKNMMHHGMGRPRFLISIPLSTWKKLLVDPKVALYQEYHVAGLLFPDFYEFEVLGKVPSPVHYTTGENSQHVCKEDFVTLSISLSKNLKDVASPEVLEEYIFFGTQTMNGKAKHSNIIQTVEKWLPGSGRQLVLEGVHCFTQFKDLSTTELMRIFNIFRSLPTYKSSLFMYEFEKYFVGNKF